MDSRISIKENELTLILKTDDCIQINILIAYLQLIGSYNLERSENMVCTFPVNGITNL